jgi:phospholipid/cholesterol/gamma-HCH transport system substrate-binding protein
MPRSGAGEGREWRVGLLVVAAVVLFGFGVFLIGEQGNLFSRKNDYVIYFPTVSGLNEGNPVQLNGVEVGTVRSVVLPTDAASEQIEVGIEVDRRYADRIREDSEARIKTLGLLGDKFVELTSGSPGAEPVPPGGVIPAAPPTNVDKLIASGEDVMDNVVQISADLRDVLQRMEEGKGLLGELTSESETGQRVTDAVIETMESIQRVAEEVEEGDGPLSRLIHDQELADSMSGSLARLEGILDKAENGDGLLPALLNDPATRERFDTTLASLRDTAANLQALSTDLQQGNGLLPRLIEDEELGDEIENDLRQVLDRVDDLTRKLEEGEGTAGKMINDPSVYEAVQDVIVGVNESRFLRWLIRNRQKKGIEKRYDEARKALEDGADDMDEPEGPEKEEGAEQPPAPEPEGGPGGEREPR